MNGRAFCEEILAKVLINAETVQVRTSLKT